MNQTTKTLLVTGLLTALFLLALSNQFLQPNSSESQTETQSASLLSIDTDMKSAKSLDMQESNLGFFENRGQVAIDGYDIRYVAETAGMKMYFTPEGIIYSFIHLDRGETGEPSRLPWDGESRTKATVSSIAMQWKNANPDVRIAADEEGEETRNYYTALASEVLTEVKSYHKITYENLYDQIDLVFYTQEEELKYDFVVKPGGNVDDIQLNYRGHEDMTLTSTGELAISGRLGEITEGTPFSYQRENGSQQEIASRYQLDGETIGFAVGDYDSTKTLVIDPTLLWATYFGGDREDTGYAVTTDLYGNVYMAGTTQSVNDIAFEGHDLNLNQNDDFNFILDAFLVKFDPGGNRLWATYYGGNKRDFGYAVATDHNGNVYLAGSTESGTDIADNGYDNVFNEDGEDGTRFRSDAFLVKFNSSGVREWATYYGGENGRSDFGHGISIDSWDNIYMTGYTNSTTGIAQDGHDMDLDQSNADSDDHFDAFLVKFDQNGDRQWGTYFGKSDFDKAEAVATDPFGNVYIAGYTESQFLGHWGQDLFYSGKEDAFLAKFNAGGQLIWSTYYGGSEQDQGLSVATDNAGSVYLAGFTKSNIGIGHNGYANALNGSSDNFLVKFSKFGIREWGTYYGGVKDEYGGRVTISDQGDVYLAGETSSDNHIASVQGFDLFHAGNRDTYVVRFNKAGQRQWGTYFGGSYNDHLMGLTTDKWGNVYMAGKTYSEEDIAYKGFDEEYADADAFLAKIKPYGNGRPGSGPGDKKDPTRTDPNRGGEAISQSSSSLPSEFYPGTGISIYPNPTTDLVNIRLPEAANGPLEIYNADGRKIHSQTSEGSSLNTIITRGWKKGLYVIKIHTPNGVISEKLIVR